MEQYNGWYIKSKISRPPDQMPTTFDLYIAWAGKKPLTSEIPLLEKQDIIFQMGKTEVDAISFLKKELDELDVDTDPAKL